MMKTKALVWNQVDKTQIPLERLVEEYLLVCRSEGKSPKTLRGYNEKLRRYVRVVGGCLGDFTLDTVREHLSSLQKARKWDGHPYVPSTQETLSMTTIRNRGLRPLAN